MAHELLMNSYIIDNQLPSQFKLVEVERPAPTAALSKTPIRQPYTPLVGRVAPDHVRRATREFERRLDGGEDDVEVMLMSHCRLDKWHDTAIDEEFHSLFVEACFSNESDVDFFIAKMRGGLHRSVAFKLFADLRRQTESIGCTYSASPEGDDIYKVPGSHLSFRRRPDLSIRLRVIFSVEVDVKSLRASLMYQKEYFQFIPELRLACYSSSTLFLKTKVKAWLQCGGVSTQRARRCDRRGGRELRKRTFASRSSGGTGWSATT